MTRFTLDNPLFVPTLVGAAVVVLGLFVYGLRDVRRLSMTRTVAVASLAFREGVRRRVLWVVPLAMLAALGVIVLGGAGTGEVAAGGGGAGDVAHAVRSLLFASGLLAVVVPLVLGSTSLPREIETRTLFGVVTKPLTRLELLLGKVLGLAWLTAVVLAGMALFSAAVLLTVDYRATSAVRQQLAGVLADEGRRPYLRHVADAGLLEVAGRARASDLQLHGIPPDAARADADVTTRWFLPTHYYASVPFDLPRDEAAEVAALATQGRAFIAVRARLAWQLLPGEFPPGSLPIGIQNPATLPEVFAPAVGVDVRTNDHLSLVAVDAFEDNLIVLPDAGHDTPWDETPAVVLPGEVSRVVGEVGSIDRFHLGVWGRTAGYAFGVTGAGGTHPGGDLRLEVIDADGRVIPGFGPYYPDVRPTHARSDVPLRTHYGRAGQGVRGPGEEPRVPTAVFAFRAVRGVAGDTVGFEVAGDAEQAGTVDDYLAVAAEGGMRARLVASDGRASPWQDVSVDTASPGYAEFDATLADTGDFDLQVQTTAIDRIVTMRPEGVRLVGAGEPFFWTYAKAVAAQWLLGVLVGTTALVLGVVVSWPVALVLTVAVLAARPAVAAAGGATGRDAVQAVFSDDVDASAAAREVVQRGYAALNTATTRLASVLPDVRVFDASPLVARREEVPLSGVGGAAVVAIGYGLPVFALGYVALRRKEVAA